MAAKISFMSTLLTILLLLQSVLTRVQSNPPENTKKSIPSFTKAGVLFMDPPKSVPNGFVSLLKTGLRSQKVRFFLRFTPACSILFKCPPRLALCLLVVDCVQFSFLAIEMKDIDLRIALIDLMLFISLGSLYNRGSLANVKYRYLGPRPTVQTARFGTVTHCLDPRYS